MHAETVFILKEKFKALEQLIQKTPSDANDALPEGSPRTSRPPKWVPTPEGVSDTALEGKDLASPSGTDGGRVPASNATLTGKIADKYEKIKNIWGSGLREA